MAMPVPPSADEILVTSTGVTTVPAPRDPETDAILTRARDLLAANVLWGYLLEVGRAGVPITLQTVHDIAEGIRLGDLPDHSLLVGQSKGLLSVVQTRTSPRPREVAAAGSPSRARSSGWGSW